MDMISKCRCINVHKSDTGILYRICYACTMEYNRFLKLLLVHIKDELYE